MRLLLIGAFSVVVGAAVLCLGTLGVSLALENQDAFCAACHTQPESAYYTAQGH